MGKKSDEKQKNVSVVVNTDDEKARKKAYRTERKNKRNRRIARGRRTKNLIIFLAGFFTSLILPYKASRAIRF